MPVFSIRQSANLYLTSHAGLAVLGQCFEAAQVDAVIDPRLPVSRGMRTSDLVKSVATRRLRAIWATRAGVWP